MSRTCLLFEGPPPAAGRDVIPLADGAIVVTSERWVWWARGLGWVLSFSDALLDEVRGATTFTEAAQRIGRRGEWCQELSARASRS